MTIDLEKLQYGTPALAVARVIAGGLQAEIEPAEAAPLPWTTGHVLLADHNVDDALLADLATALPEAAAVVIWFDGIGAEAAGEKLAEYGFEHGSVEQVDVPTAGAVAILAPSADAAEAQQRLLARRRPPFRALAIMPVFNEADVVERSVAALVSQGVDVYVFDHRSTDGSAEVIERWLGRGLVKIERFPDEAGYDEQANGQSMVWREILRRVEDISAAVPADWHLFVNADEFREAPWPEMTLADGLLEAQQLGYNAVNFELVNFMPTEGDQFVAGEDVREHLLHYEPPGAFDLLQIKAWNSGGVRPDMVSHGGHSVLFEGRRVFGVPFILRHYPIRSVEHGMRKVHGERLARFDTGERADGWHVQYDAYAAGAAEFLRDRDICEVWDPMAFRARLLSRAMHQQQLLHAVTGPSGELDPHALVAWLQRRGIDDPKPQELEAAAGLVRIGRAPTAADGRVGEIATALASAFEAQAIAAADMVAAGSLRDLIERAA